MKFPAKVWQRFLTISGILFLVACSLWEYEDPSDLIDNLPPETHISLIATDTIYARIDSINIIPDPVTGETYEDTVWIYAFNDSLDPGFQWDTLTNAFTTITNSQQYLKWWGDDPDGDVVGYFYKWDVDTAWTFTQNEEKLFFVPIRHDLDAFRFRVKAMDNDSLLDSTPAELVLPIQNTPPEISFRYRSNPLSSELPTNIAYTFPTRTFVWDIADQDGIESITNVFYTLDDPCDTCWTAIDAVQYSSVTLTQLSPGEHTFYLKTKDIAGAESEIITFPDTNNTDEPNTWIVKAVTGNVLLVDDFPQNSNNETQNWYRSILDTALVDTYSVWEIGERLPYSSVDVTATLTYFDHVIWYSARTGIETYDNAEASIYSYLLDGGNFLLCAPELTDTTYTWFPLRGYKTINPTGRLFPGTVLESSVRDDLDLEVSYLIAIRVRSFTPDSSQFSEIREMYHMADPQPGDSWTGNPIVGALGRFQVSATQQSGKAVLFSLPLHNGTVPTLDGQGSSGKFIKYLLTEEFISD